MKVSEYIKSGLKNYLENTPSDYKLLGEAQEKIHKIRCFIKLEDNIITDAKFNSSKRCKKLMAIADLVCEKLKGQNINQLSIDEKEILSFFEEEKDKDKLSERLNLVKKAILN